MRPILAGDIYALARTLEVLPDKDRLATCTRLMNEAEFADKYRKRFGVLHPQWGNGSLMGRVGKLSGWAGAAPLFQSAEFCVSVGVVLEVLDCLRRQKSHSGGRANLPKRITISELPP